MFLKIVQKDDDKRETNESVYDCKTYRKIQSKDGYQFILDDDLCIAINGETRRTIYIMNNEGKTIDRMYWKHK